MAIATSTAILGAAIIGGGAAMLGSGAQSKAAGKAADASQYGYDLQYRLGQDSLALNQGIYNQNYALASPFIANGLGASNQLSAMLGITPASVPANALASAAPATGAGTPVGGSTGGSLPGNVAGIVGQGGQIQAGNYQPLAGVVGSGTGQSVMTGGEPQGTSARPMLRDYSGDGAGWREALQGWRAGQAPAAGGAPASGAAPATGGVTGQNAAFNNFKNSAGFDFAMDTMADAVNNRYAAAGALESGAAMKAIQDRASDVAIQGYLMPYMGMLGGQQNMGAGMASSVMGVGANFGQTAAGINGQIGNAAGQNAANLGNIYQQQGQNKADMWAGLGSSFNYGLQGLGGAGGGGGIVYNGNPQSVW